jgi:hypothetical protein
MDVIRRARSRPPRPGRRRKRRLQQRRQDQLVLRPARQPARPEWHRRAACRGKAPDAWFPTEHGRPSPEALETYAGRVVRTECWRRWHQRDSRLVGWNVTAGPSAPTPRDWPQPQGSPACGGVIRSYRDRHQNGQSVALAIGTRPLCSAHKSGRKRDGVPTRRCACCQGPQTQRLPSVT